MTAEEELGMIAAQVRECTKCPLYEGRKNAVPGDGPSYSEIMIIGEGPGAQEDATGHPFVGAAGKLLAKLLESIGLERSEVFITNIVKCRPPNNRPPRKGEAAVCTQLYLDPQVRLIGPRIIVALGTPAIQWVMGEEFSATKVHGKVFRKDGRLILPLYHPAAALYDDRLRETMFQDMSVLKDALEGKVEQVVSTIR